MAKVLIAPIGTGAKNKDEISMGEYKTAKYCFNGEIMKESSFISAILAEMLDIDKIIFIGTAKSMWDEVYRFFSKDSLDYDYWLKLADMVERSNVNESHLHLKDLIEVQNSIDNYLRALNSRATGGSEVRLINYGIDEKEMWDNFDIIMGIKDCIDEGDEIFLDITHSFRSIPMFLYLLIDFFKTLHMDYIKLSGIYYGMLDVINELGYAPIINLEPLFKISELAKGTYDFINYGNSYLISNVLRHEKLINESIYKRMNNTSDLININYLTALKVQMDRLRDEMREIKIEGVLRYINPLIITFLDKFAKIETDSEFQLELSKWYLKNKKYGHAYICLEESILTRLCEIYDINTNEFINRRYMKHLIKKKTFRGQINPLRLLGLYESYKAINVIRNRIAHAEFYSKGEGQFRSDINLLGYHIKNIQEKIFDNDIKRLPLLISLEDIKRECAP